MGATRGTAETFAVDALLLGDVDRSGQHGYYFRAFGYDLDGLITNKDSTNVCQLAPGASRYAQVDGNGGIDNATGETLLPILESAASLLSPSATATQVIRGGTWTLQIQLDGLSAGSTNVVGVGAQIFVSGQYDAGAPAFDATTNWPVLTSSLLDGATIGSGALVSFEDAYVTSDGTFVSGVPSDRPIIIPVALPTAPNSPAGGAPAILTLRVYHAVLTFTRTSAEPTRLLNGTIAGVLYTQEIIDAAAQCARRMDTTFCGSVFNGFATEIQQAQDILRDGTNAPDIACDAISIGLGFTARQVANPTKVAPPASSPDPCDAGTDGGGDGSVD